MTMKRAIGMLVISVLASIATQAVAQGERAEKIAASYASLAGSRDNAIALVEALRYGAPVKLAQPEPTATRRVPVMIVLEPPTGEMQWTDVDTALGMAQEALARARIVQPTFEQLEAALLGGDVANEHGETFAFAGILTLHASGVPWAAVARLAGPRPR
jgi:hypothetical protein